MHNGYLYQVLNRSDAVSYLVVEAVEVSELHHLRAGVDARGEQLGVNRRYAYLVRTKQTQEETRKHSVQSR